MDFIILMVIPIIVFHIGFFFLGDDEEYSKKEHRIFY